MIRLHADPVDLQASFAEIAASGTFTEGRYSRLFEDEVATWSDQRAISCNSCGSGLLMLAMALFDRDEPGTVIIPSNTFYATGAMMREAGWHVALADCALDDFSLTPDTLLAAEEAHLERNRAHGTLPPIKAVVLTHVGGGLALRYAAIASLCRHRGWHLIEDAAHVLGTRDAQGFVAGSLGTAACFSLYPTKAVPAGDGGAVTTHDADLEAELRLLRNYGKHMVDGVVRYGRGFNFRLDEWTSAVAYHQMRKLPEIAASRSEVARRLHAVCPPMVDWDGFTNWYKYIVPAAFPATRTAGRVYARSDQLASIFHDHGKYPVSEHIATAHKCLPVDADEYAGMETLDIEAHLCLRC